MNVRARLVETGSTENGTKDLSPEDNVAQQLATKLEQAKKDLDAALCNSFDTFTAMQVISRIIRDGNIYMNESNANIHIVEEVARWVTKIVGILGLDSKAKPPYDGLGWSSSDVTAASNVDPKTAVLPYAAVFSRVVDEIKALKLSEPSLQRVVDQQSPESEFSQLEISGEKVPENLALPYIRAVSRLRDELRRTVSSASLGASTKPTVLGLADRIRDYDLADLGVQLDDQMDKPSLIKFVPASRLIAAREEKAALIAEKALQKEQGMCFYLCRYLS